MNLFEEILNDIVNPEIKTADILRKAKVLAYRLNIPEFKGWISNELQGYPTDDSVPDYRRLQCACYGDYVAGTMFCKHAEIPVHKLPPDIVKQVTTINLHWPIGQIESTTSDPKNNGLHFGFPAEFLAIVRHHIGVHYGKAEMYVGKQFAIAVIDTVRNRLLDFMLELQDRIPEITSSVQAIRKVPERELTQIFMTSIRDISGSNVAINHSSISQSSASVTNPSELLTSIQALKVHLADVASGERSEIETALEVLQNAVTEEGTIAKSALVSAVETSARIPAIKDHLIAIAVNATGGIAASGIVEAIKFVLCS